MRDYAEPIKSAVTMPMALSMYGYPTPRYRRIPCPIHNGKDNNFAYKDRHFVCYVCGAQGDVITFVQKLFGLGFMDACRKIDKDFHLGLNIDGELSREEQERAEREAAERRRIAQERRKRRQDAQRAYDSALTEFARLDRAIMEQAPELPCDDFTDEFVYALKWIDLAWMELIEAHWKLKECGKR